MEEQISVLRATRDDVESIRSLLVDLIAVLGGTEGINMEAALGNCMRFLSEATHGMLVAKSGGSVVGFLNFTTRQSILHDRPSLLIDELVVASGCRGKGIGKMLVAAVTDEAVRLGCSEIEVSTEKSNTRAREFYRRCNFQEDAVLFEKRLQ